MVGIAFPLPVPIWLLNESELINFALTPSQLCFSSDKGRATYLVFSYPTSAMSSICLMLNTNTSKLIGKNDLARLVQVRHTQS